MSISKTLGPALAGAAMLVGLTALGGVAPAGPLSLAVTAAADHAPAGVQPVRHGRWGGVGIYIGPGYGYYPDDGYYDGYYDDDYYYSRRRSSYYYDRYDRPSHRHSRRWVKERFEHPLGRR
jgi:hypothetical protein